MGTNLHVFILFSYIYKFSFYKCLFLFKVAQLLLTVEQGDLNKWKGKKLSEIELEGKFPRE